MKLQKYVIDSLRGMQPLRTPGSSALHPTLLERLSFSKPEGYEPVSQDELDYPASALAGAGHFLGGRDSTGLLTILRPGPAATIVQGATVLADESIVPSTATATHVPRFGLYEDEETYLGINRDGDVVHHGGLVGMSPTFTEEDSDADSVGESSDGAMPSGVIDYLVLYVIPTEAGRLVVGYEDHYRWFLVADEDEGWMRTQITTPTAGATPSWNAASGIQYEVYTRYRPDERGQNPAVRKRLFGREFVLAAVMDPGESKWVGPPSVGRTLPDVGQAMRVAMGGHAAEMGGRLWFVPDADIANYEALTTWTNPTVTIPIDDLARPMTLAFTEIGYMNLAGVYSYVNLPQGASTQITGLAETSGGLMVFGENDAYLLSGDPATGDLRVEPFPSSVGCDDGFQPATLGGLVFTIWRGRLYLLDGATVTDLSQGVLDGRTGDGAAIDMVADPMTNTVAVLTVDGLLRFDIERGEWYSHTPYRGSDGTDGEWPSDARLAPSPTGLRFFTLSGTSRYVVSYATEAIGSRQRTGTIEWRGIDGGDPLRRDYWRSLRVPLDLREGEGVDLSVGPYLYYAADENDPEVSDEDEDYRLDGSLTDGELVFRLPWGVVSRRIDLRLVVRLEQGAAIQPGITVGFVPGHEGDST